MKVSTPLITVSLVAFVTVGGGWCGRAFAADQTAAIPEGEARWREFVLQQAQANFFTACVDVTHEVAAKRVTIYGLVKVKPEVLQEGGFAIEVRYHPSLATGHSETAGTYSNHHNHCVLQFAAAEYVAGRKQLGLLLMRLLLAAQPEMFWSHPDHKPMALKQFLAVVEKEDDDAKQVLRLHNASWLDKVQTYGSASRTR